MAEVARAMRPLRIGPVSLPLPTRSNRYRWDAVRFAHKSHAIFDAARRGDIDALIRIDADTRIAEGVGWRASHVLVNSRLGAFMDHMKGNRKTQGSSHAGDLVAARAEPYWRELPR